MKPEYDALDEQGEYGDDPLRAGAGEEGVKVGKVFVCPRCNREFKRRYELDAHIRDHQVDDRRFK